MSVKRFYALPAAFDAAGGRVTLEADEAHHLIDVLRLGVGERVAVFDGAGGEFACRVIEVSKLKREWRVTLEVLEQIAAPHAESPLELTLGVALLKSEKFDFVVQKATELGVKKILPIATSRADVKLNERGEAGVRVERWRRIALEAAKQAGRAVVPQVQQILTFSKMVEATTSNNDESGRLLFSERGGVGLYQALEKIEARTSFAARSRIIAVTGAEGGWTDAELSLAKSHGWEIVTLGGRVVRAETAAIAVCVLLQHLKGDVR